MANLLIADRAVILDVLEREQIVREPLSQVFEFFAGAENLERITPRWLSFHVLTGGAVAMRPGALIDYRLRLHGLPLRWTSLIETCVQDRRFVDRQVRGPYRFWRHEHVFTETDGGTCVRDRVEYALPLGRLGRGAGSWLVRRDLARIFDYRRAAVERLLG